MKKLKNNEIIDLNSKNDYEKTIELGKLSKKINSIFQKNTNNKKKKK